MEKNITVIEECTECANCFCSFNALSEEQFKNLSKHSHRLELKPKQVLVNQGQIPNKIMYLRSGIVKEVRKDEILGDQLCRIITKNSYLGLPSFFTDTQSKTTFIALTKVSVCVLDKFIFKNLIFENGKFAYEILTNCGRDNINNYYHSIELSHKQIYGRVADTLLHLSDNVYQSTEFQNLLSREEMAMMINSTRESVTRAIRNFVKEGIISSQGHKIKILNREKLLHISKHG